MPSETAPVPAPESQPSDSVGEDSNPGSPGGPINLNVDIRILSPGDNGDVKQEITVPGWSAPVGDGAQGQPLAWTWNWTWNWTTPPRTTSETWARLSSARYLAACRTNQASSSRTLPWSSQR